MWPVTTTSRPTSPPAAVRTAALAFAVDVVCVLLFCAVGRRNHDEAMTLAGLAHTSWPFLAGLSSGWLVIRGWRRPTAVRSTGLAVWVSTIVIGMGLRAATGAGTALSFVVVATVTTGALLLGWRAARAAVTARRR